MCAYQQNVKKGYEKRSFHTALGMRSHVITDFTVFSKIPHVVSKSTRRGLRDMPFGSLMPK